MTRREEMSASVISPTDRVILARSRDRAMRHGRPPSAPGSGVSRSSRGLDGKGGTGTGAMAQPMLPQLGGRRSRAAPTRDNPDDDGPLTKAENPRSGGRHDEREDSTWRSAPRSVRAHCFRGMGVGASGENGVRQ